MIALIVWIVFGLLAGSIAEAICPPPGPSNRWQTIGVGIAGSVVGGLIGSVFSGSHYRPAGVVMSVVGAVICTWALRLLRS